MRPTRRGWAVVATVVLAVASAATFGPRGLNALAAPGVVALAAAAWQVQRFEPPTVERELPERGERGATVTVRLHLHTPTERPGTVVESVGEGLEAAGASRDVLLGETSVTYELTLLGRGERSLGPLTIVVRDVLGLLRRTVRDRGTASILVRPRVRPLGGTAADELAWFHGGASDDRHAFEGLRQYHRGDPLRDIHWASSAKRPPDEFVVKQFAVEEERRTVEVAASASQGAADEMAEAAASVVLWLVDVGVRVALTTPDGRIASDDPGGRDAILDHLALAGEGQPVGATRRDVDLFINAGPDRVVVETAGRQLAFDDLAATPGSSPDLPREAAP